MRDRTRAIFPSGFHLRRAAIPNENTGALFIFGMSIPITLMLSAFNLSSMTNIFLILNQMRILILLLLTEAYFPEALINYITGFKFALFSFSFISLQDVEGLNKLLSWADICSVNFTPRGRGGVQFLKIILKKFENQTPAPLILRKFYHNFFSKQLQ